MTISSVGTLGTASHSTSSTSFTLTTTATLNEGNNAILVIAIDNTATGADGDYSEVSSITDSAGNSWYKLSEYTNTNSSAGAGVTVSVWVSFAFTQLSSGGVITINLSNSVTDKAASAWEFAGNGTNRINNEYVAVKNATDGSNGFGSSLQDTFNVPGDNRLYFRGLAKEANTTTALTPTASFTAISNERSRNDANAVCVYGEFIISTNPDETSNPTLAVSGDTAGVFLALFEDPAAPIGGGGGSNKGAHMFPGCTG